MNSAEILLKLNEIFKDIFNNPSLTISLQSKNTDIQGWDSLAQINIYSAIEADFNVKLTIADMEQMNSIENMVNTIKAKI